MNPLFDEALSFVSDTVRRFYAGTGIEQVVERFSDDLSWIGAGEVEFSTSAEEIVSYLTKRAPLAPPCEVFDEEFYLVNVTECSCTVMGRYNVRTREDSQLVIEERQRCSYELVEVSGGTAAGMVHAPDRAQALADVARCFAEGPTYETEYRARRKDGTLAWVLDSGRKVQTEDGAVKIGSVLMDITSRKEAEIALAVERERYRIALRSVTDVLFEYDIERDVLVEYERAPGADGSALPEERRIERYTEMIAEGERIHPDDCERLAEALQGGESVTLDVRRRFGGSPEGDWRWTRMHAMMLYDRNGAPVRTIGSWRDITAERRQLEDLADQARRDPLTGLFNQSATSELIDPLLRTGAKRGVGALLVIDIDDFKGVNDTFGHLAGDELLSNVARSLEEALASDDAIVARIGGDEFVAYLPHADLVQAQRAALRVNGQRCEGRALVTLSVGGALAGIDGGTYESLFDAADRALYEAKRKGKDRVSFAGEARP